MKINKAVFKETSEIVISGLVVNYPLSIVIIWLIVEVMDITNALAIASISTAIMTVFAYLRVYTIRLKNHKKNDKL